MKPPAERWCLFNFFVLIYNYLWCRLTANIIVVTSKSVLIDFENASSIGIFFLVKNNGIIKYVLSYSFFNLQ